MNLTNLLRKSVGAVTALTLMAATQALAQDSIKIGVAMELSGRFVAYGASGKRGAEFALEVYGGKVAGMPVDLVVRDLQSDPQATVSTFNELVNGIGVNYIIGPIASPIVAAAIPTWRQKKPIWIVPGSSSTTLEREIGDQPEFFHTFPYAYHYHESLVTALSEQIGTDNTVAIVYTDDNYGQTHLPHLKAALDSAGMNVISEEVVRTNASDMNPVLTRIARAKPDVLFALLQTTDAVTLTKQAYIRHLPVKYLIGTAAVQLDEWQKAVGEAQEDWIGVTTYLPGLHRPGNAEFPELFPPSDEWEEKFRSKYGQEPDFEDAGNYVSMMMLLMAIEQVGADDKQKVMEELAKMEIPNTLLGNGKFSKSSGGTLHQAFTDMVVFQRRGGENVMLYPKTETSGSVQAVEY